MNDVILPMYRNEIRRPVILAYCTDKLLEISQSIVNTIRVVDSHLMNYHNYNFYYYHHRIIIIIRSSHHE